MAVSGYRGAEYKAFESRAAAEAALRGDYADYAGKPAAAQQAWLFAPVKPLIPSLCVDAACSGSPGPLEYRGVHTETGEEIFRKGPFAEGSNNVGEFLAIVHALAWLRERGLDWPVYSDSENAIGWVKEGKCRTKLQPTPANCALFDLIDRAEAWLADYVIAMRAAGRVAERIETQPGEAISVLKWDTEAWGEIPADFGRK